MIPRLHQTILIVEDCDEDYDSAVSALQKSGSLSAIRRAISGEECISFLRGEAATRLMPDLILMDLNLPGTDGRETIREIKGDLALKTIPIVVFTTSSNPRDIEICYSFGANAYHVKPLPYKDYVASLGDIFVYWLERVYPPEHPKFSLLD